jgi:hypothetical protein
MKRVLALALAAVVPLCLAGTAEAGVTTEILSLDAYQSPNDGTAGPVSTSKTLDNGAFYGVVATGTFSFYGPEQWSVPPSKAICGTPEPAPQRPSPGRTNGKVGMDVETIFATPFQFDSCGGFHPPVHWTSFQMNTGSGFTHVEPVDGAHSTPNRYHTYAYLIRGSGQPASFELQDADTTDNYGVVTILVQRLRGDDCKKDGWRQYGGQFKNQGDCVSYFATGGRNEGDG